MRNKINNTLLLIEVIRSEKIDEKQKEIESLLSKGVDPFLKVNGSCAFKEAAVKGNLSLIEKFCRYEGASKVLNSVLVGPYDEIELKLDNLPGASREGISVFKSHNNTLLHSVCKSETFNIRVLGRLIELGGLRCMDNVNDMDQTPESCIEYNIFVNDKLKMHTKKLFYKARELIENIKMKAKVKRENSQVMVAMESASNSTIVKEERKPYIKLEPNVVQNQVPTVHMQANVAAVVPEVHMQGSRQAIIMPKDIKREQDVRLAEEVKRRGNLQDPLIIRK